MEDRELIRRIQGGQKDYLNEIAEKYYDDIYYFCCYQTGSREDAYDLAQDTFLRFIRYVDQYRYQNLKGYLLTIAMNLCRNYSRKPGKDSAIQGSDAYEEWKKEETAGVLSQEYEDRENILVIREALQKLPAIQREAVLLHHFYGYKNREISRMTGASYGAVKSRIRKGIEKLQQLLNKEDFYGR
ncbi:MAG: RNA polymerase sigma factor [Ruminococcus sp.]|nr:RNA polymerase sigma factor [Ruminococcus sp.]